MKIYKVLPVIILLFCSSCKTNYEKAEHALKKRFSSSLPYADLKVKPLNVFQEFENELLKRNIIDSVSKESYSRLMYHVISDSIRINTEEISQQNGEIQILSTPMIIASFLKSFGEVREKYNLTDKNHSIVKVADITEEIEATGDIGNLKLNEKLINQINDEDFKMIIYRAPFLAIIYDITERNYWKKKNAR